MSDEEEGGKQILPFRFLTEQGESSSKLRYTIKERAVHLLVKELVKYGYSEDSSKNIANNLKEMYQFVHLNPRLLAGAYSLWVEVMNTDMNKFPNIDASSQYATLLSNISGKRADSKEATNKRSSDIRKDVLRYITAIKQTLNENRIDLQKIIEEFKASNRSGGLLLQIIPPRRTFDIIPAGERTLSTINLPRL